MRSLKFFAAVSLVSILNLAGLVVIAGVLRFSAGAGPVATMNGDVNGDGSLNIADGIYLLTHLFSDGPPPVAIAGPPPVPEQSWPPKPWSIVNIDTAQFDTDSDGVVVIQPGESLQLYQVPIDKWFVVTDVYRRGLVEISKVELIEVGSTGEIVKLGASAWSSTLTEFFAGMPIPSGHFSPAHGLGLAFAPGSQVMVRHICSPCSPELLVASLTGYLAEAP